MLPVLEAEAPLDREAVGDPESVEEAETVELGVAWGVPVPL